MERIPVRSPLEGPEGGPVVLLDSSLRAEADVPLRVLLDAEDPALPFDDCLVHECTRRGSGRSRGTGTTQVHGAVAWDAVQPALAADERRDQNWRTLIDRETGCEAMRLLLTADEPPRPSAFDRR